MVWILWCLILVLKHTVAFLINEGTECSLFYLVASFHESWRQLRSLQGPLMLSLDDGIHNSTY